MDVLALRKQIKTNKKPTHNPTKPFPQKQQSKLQKFWKKVPPAFTNYKLLKVVKIQKQIHMEMYKQMQKQDQNLGKQLSKLPPSEMN